MTDVDPTQASTSDQRGPRLEPSRPRVVLLGVCWLIAAVMIAVGCGARFGTDVGLIVGGALAWLLAWLAFGDVT